MRSPTATLLGLLSIIHPLVSTSPLAADSPAQSPGLDIIIPTPLSPQSLSSSSLDSDVDLYNIDDDNDDDDYYYYYYDDDSEEDDYSYISIETVEIITSYNSADSDTINQLADDTTRDIIQDMMMMHALEQPLSQEDHYNLIVVEVEEKTTTYFNPTSDIRQLMLMAICVFGGVAIGLVTASSYYQEQQEQEEPMEEEDKILTDILRRMENGEKFYRSSPPPTLTPPPLYPGTLVQPEV